MALPLPQEWLELMAQQPAVLEEEPIMMVVIILPLEIVDFIETELVAKAQQYSLWAAPMAFT